MYLHYLIFWAYINYVGLSNHTCKLHLNSYYVGMKRYIIYVNCCYINFSSNDVFFPKFLTEN